MNEDREEGAADGRAELKRGLAGARAPDPRALAALALCVGGVTVARGLDDEALASALLDACRTAAERELDAPTAAGRARRRAGA